MPVRKRLMVGVFAAVGLLTGATQAREVHHPARSTAITFNLGVASAVGAAGFAVRQAFGNHVQIEGGGGLGFSGWQVSLMPKLAFGSPVFHFLCGAGLSVTFPGALGAVGHPIWLNIDAVGVESISKDGFTVMLAAGWTKGVGNGGLVGTFISPAEAGHNNVPTNVSEFQGPQFRLGLGYAF